MFLTIQLARQTANETCFTILRVIRRTFCALLLVLILSFNIRIGERKTIHPRYDVSTNLPEQSVTLFEESMAFESLTIFTMLFLDEYHLSILNIICPLTLLATPSDLKKKVFILKMQKVSAKDQRLPSQMITPLTVAIKQAFYLRMCVFVDTRLVRLT